MCRTGLEFWEGLHLIVMFCAARLTGNVLEREDSIAADRGIYLDLHYRNQLIARLTNRAQIPSVSPYFAAF
jgi:hypothetical protein